MTELSKIKVGIIGCGMMGQEHISYMKGFSDVEVLFLCDPTPPSLEKAVALVTEDGRCEPRTFSDEKDMFNDKDVQQNLDLLVIATPNYLHTPQLLRWGQREITILIEKPVAISELQVQALRAASSTLRADVWVAMEYRYISAIQKLLQILPCVGQIKKISIRENRYPFLKKIGEWNKDIDKSGDTLVEKCCHFFDLFRLISGCEMKGCSSMVHRGLNFEDYGYHSRNDDPIPIIDGAYVLLDLAGGLDEAGRHLELLDEEKVEEVKSDESHGHKSALGCLELCMFAEGSRHQEEIIVTGMKGRLEAYLPENKVFMYTRPSEEDWPDKSIPPLRTAIKERVFDCSDLSNVYSFANEVPNHSGYHYCSTSIEWKHLIDQIRAKRRPNGTFVPQVSLEDGIRAVEMGIAAMNNIANKSAAATTSFLGQDKNMKVMGSRNIYPIVACSTLSSENLLQLALLNNLSVTSIKRAGSISEFSTQQTIQE